MASQLLSRTFSKRLVPRAQFQRVPACSIRLGYTGIRLGYTGIQHNLLRSQIPLVKRSLTVCCSSKSKLDDSYRMRLLKQLTSQIHLSLSTAVFRMRNFNSELEAEIRQLGHDNATFGELCMKAIELIHLRRHPLYNLLAESFSTVILIEKTLRSIYLYEIDDEECLKSIEACMEDISKNLFSTIVAVIMLGLDAVVSHLGLSERIESQVLSSNNITPVDMIIKIIGITFDDIIKMVLSLIPTIRSAEVLFDHAAEHFIARPESTRSKRDLSEAEVDYFLQKYKEVYPKPLRNDEGSDVIENIIVRILEEMIKSDSA